MVAAAAESPNASMNAFRNPRVWAEASSLYVIVRQRKIKPKYTRLTWKHKHLGHAHGKQPSISQKATAAVHQMWKRPTRTLKKERKLAWLRESMKTQRKAKTWGEVAESFP